MKEIDLLPEWYKSVRRQQISYRAQYIALGCIFVLMVVWNFVAVHSASKGTAELTQMAPRQAQAERISQEFDEIESEMARLWGKADILKKVDSEIDVANVLAEISFLIDEKIVLSIVEFKAGMFVNKQESKINSNSAVREAQGRSGNREIPLLGDVKFNVVISGVAADAGDVAELICSLEDSSYFRCVIPSFSRNRDIKTGARSASRDYQVSEFEISCELANYQQEEFRFVKE